MYETTDLEVNTNELEDEDYDDERPTWGQDDGDYNKTAPVSVVNPKFEGVLPTGDVGNGGRSAIPEAVATDAKSSTDTGSAEGEGKGVDKGVFPGDEVNDATVSAVQTDRFTKGPSKAQEEQDEGHTVHVVTEEVVRDESTVFDDDCDWGDCFRDGELVERSEPTEEGEHSDDEDPADEALGTLSADAEMIRAGAVAGVAEAGPASQPQGGSVGGCREERSAT
ncbi:hypothetical protein PR002_g6928 [Phytophthora rubi]|uniref:Uncharacterized protein n=1 Tax=Phytophthora rubi TaxID=129364 RepID=A0A6A3N5A5_9STRA|nr:hypothetical protein PR002_g6928 [Phytophthora rubi]